MNALSAVGVLAVPEVASSTHLGGSRRHLDYSGLMQECDFN